MNQKNQGRVEVARKKQTSGLRITGLSLELLWTSIAQRLM